jgi:hypothetical protein
MTYKARRRRYTTHHISRTRGAQSKAVFFSWYFFGRKDMREVETRTWCRACFNYTHKPQQPLGLKHQGPPRTCPRIPAPSCAGRTGLAARLHTARGILRRASGQACRLLHRALLPLAGVLVGAIQVHKATAGSWKSGQVKQCIDLNHLIPTHLVYYTACTDYT